MGRPILKEATDYEICRHLSTINISYKAIGYKAKSVKNPHFVGLIWLLRKIIVYMATSLKTPKDLVYFISSFFPAINKYYRITSHWVHIHLFATHLFPYLNSKNISDIIVVCRIYCMTRSRAIFATPRLRHSARHQSSRARAEGGDG